MKEKNCKEPDRDQRQRFQDSLILYHFGELDAAEAARVRGHLGSCEGCRGELDGLARALEALPACTPGGLETAMAVRGVRKRLKQKAIRRKRMVPAFIATAATAAAILGAIYIPQYIAGAPREHAAPVVLAQADWEVIENFDVIGDLDVIEEMDTFEGIE